MPQARTIVVSCADRAYADLALGLIHSLLELRPRETKLSFDIGIVDAGGFRDSLGSVHGQVVVVETPELYVPEPKVEKSRAYLISRSIKPFLPRYFPGYGTYIYIDADAWVQDSAALRALHRGARERDVAAAPKLHPAYDFYWDSAKAGQHDETHFNAARDAFGAGIAAELMRRPSINAGVFAARAASPFWDAYASALGRAFANMRDNLKDQPAFNYAAQLGGVTLYPLSSVCNWICYRSLPYLDFRTWTLKTATLPHETIGIVHLTRPMIGKPLAVRTATGTVEFPLDYFGFKAAAKAYKAAAGQNLSR